MLSSRLARIKNNTDGFTLLEIVIAIGLLFIVSSVGVMAIRDFDDRTKEAAVQRAAREVYNAARAKVEDGNANTKAIDAATEYNSSQSSRTANNNRPITVKVIEKSASNPNDLRVEAYYDGGRIMSSYETPTAEGGSGGSGGSGNGGVIIPTIEDTVSQLTYQCDSTMTGRLPVYNISDSTTVSLIGSDGSEKMVDYDAPNLTQVESSYSTIDFTKYTGFNNVSEEVTMKAGVTYTVKVYGKFTNLSAVNKYTADNAHGDNLSFRSCLISVDKLGKDSGLMSMNWIGAAKFKSVPETVPTTIVNMNCAFASATTFNDPNVSNWDTGNVKELHYGFLYNYAFNQPLNWNTGSIWNFSATFHQTRVFNNGGKPMRWDTSSATTLNSMFSGASGFNQNVSEYTDPTTGMKYWDTSKVTQMPSVFRNTPIFNNGGGNGVGAPNLMWKTDNVLSMATMFENSPSFNALIYRSGAYWNVSKVTNFSGTFRNAIKFNRGIGNWQTTSATNMSGTFTGAAAFNQPLASWRTDKVTNMTAMFKDAKTFNRDVSHWNATKVSVANRADFNTGSPMANNSAYQPKWS